MEYTGKSRIFEYGGRSLRLLNQSCPEWTQYYGYPELPGEANDTLHDAGCGIFSVAHVIDWATGEKIDVAELADFSCRSGGRGDDGTDRPALLAAMQRDGRLTRALLRYDGDGLRNDHEALWQTLGEGGYALCNLRVGHIVAVVARREFCGERQILIIDSSRDSMHPQVRTQIREVVEGSQICAEYRNKGGVCTGFDQHYALYWVPLALAGDFNLLHRL